MKAAAIAFALCLSGFAAASALAQTTEDLAGVVRSGLCPDDLTPYGSVEYSEHCAGMDEACATSDSGCFEDAKRCWDDVNRMNKEIYTYNAFLHQCAQRASGHRAPTKP